MVAKPAQTKKTTRRRSTKEFKELDFRVPYTHFTDTLREMTSLAPTMLHAANGMRLHAHGTQKLAKFHSADMAMLSALEDIERAWGCLRFALESAAEWLESRQPEWDVPFGKGGAH